MRSSTKSGGADVGRVSLACAKRSCRATAAASVMWAGTTPRGWGQLSNRKTGSNVSASSAAKATASGPGRSTMTAKPPVRALKAERSHLASTAALAMATVCTGWMTSARGTKPVWTASSVLGADGGDSLSD